MKTSFLAYWNARPSVVLAGALGTGIVLAGVSNTVSFVEWAAAGSGWCGLLLFGRLYTATKRPLRLSIPIARTAAVFLLVILLGGARFSFSRLVDPHDLFWYAQQVSPDQKVGLDGEVIEAPVRRAHQVTFIVNVDRLVNGNQPLPVCGKTSVYLVDEALSAFSDLAPGTRIHLAGNLRPIRGKRNPAFFDFRAYAFRRGIYSQVLVTNSAGLTVTGFPHRFDFKQSARNYVRRRLEQYVSDPEVRDIQAAFLIGDRTGLDETTIDDFKKTGLMHLLAISGLHILVFGMVLYNVLRPLLVRLRLAWSVVEVIRFFLTSGILLAYMVVVGSTPSVVRAVIMAIVFMGGNVIQRPHRTLNSLGVSACIILLVDPQSLYDPGFQLSFAAVAAILLVHPLQLEWIGIERIKNKTARWTITSISVSLAATLGTAPVMLAHFGQISLAGLFLNIPAIPLSFAAMVSGAGVVVFGGWAGPIASAYAAAASFSTDLLLLIAHLGHVALSRLSIRYPSVDPYVLLSMVFLLLSLACWQAPRWRWGLIIGSTFFLAVNVWKVAAFERRALDVLFFDVGQGDAALMVTPSGRHLLIDTGPASRTSDAGDRIILPYLQAAGIHHLDAVVISHADTDHAGGLISLLRGIHVDRLVLNARREQDTELRRVFAVVDSLNLHVDSLYVPDTLMVDPYVYIQALSPPNHTGWSGNDRSIVLFVAFGSSSFLFTGDAGIEAETEMIRRFGRTLHSQVVKVGHHGSTTSSSPAFVARVLSDSTDHIAVISAGERNRYGLPAVDVVERWKHLGATIEQTSSGAVWLRSDGQTVRKVDWK